MAPPARPSNDPSPSSLILPAGTTKLFGTATALGLAIDSILATSTRLICTAFVMDPNNTVPNSGRQLTIVATTNQKAAH